MELSCHLKSHGFLSLPIKNSCHKPHMISMIRCSTSTTTSVSRTKKRTNLCEVLSLESSQVGSSEIKKAYRSMARQYHPDVEPASRKEEATRRFVELQKAYETLSNPLSREKYDYELKLGGGTGLHTGKGEKNFSKGVWENQLEGLKQRLNGGMKENMEKRS